MAMQVAAQKLPKPTRDVYKCEQGGKVVYSDVPCLGASKVDVEPTRGLDSMSGKKMTGADVRRERTNEAIAEAYKPLFNETAQQRETRHRRFKLPANAQQQCAQLDARLPVLEQREQEARQADLAAVQKDLLGARQQYRALGC